MQIEGLYDCRKAKVPDVPEVECNLFAQFPDQGSFRPLVNFQLAAGKFPQARERLASRTLRDQHAAKGVTPFRSDDWTCGKVRKDRTSDRQILEL
jgi:hypothetical protein